MLSSYIGPRIVPSYKIHNIFLVKNSLLNHMNMCKRIYKKNQHDQMSCRVEIAELND